MDKNTNYSLMDSIEKSISKRVEGLESKNAKTLTWFILAISILLAIAAQVSSMLALPDVINIALNLPSGVLFFIFLYIFFEALQGKITEYKEKHPVRKRINRLILVWAFALPVGLLIGLTPVKAFGATFIIALFLLTLSFLRRTPQEAEYIAKGLIDPRELEDDK